MKLHTFVTILMMVCLFCFPYLLMAQGNPGTDPDNGNGVPIDGGLSLLVAAGIGYGFKKAYDKRKKEQQPPTDDTVIK